MFLFSLLCLSHENLQSLTNFYDSEPSKLVLEEQTNNFTIFRNRIQYKCFEFAKPMKFQNWTLQKTESITKEHLKNIVSVWVISPTQFLELHHFKFLKFINSSSKTIIAFYNNEPFLLNDNTITTTWKDQNIRVTFEYKCDPAAKPYGTIESVLFLTNKYYRIVYACPQVCNLEQLRPSSNISNTNCYKASYFNEL